jgi:hypothetical protein
VWENDGKWGKIKKMIEFGDAKSTQELEIPRQFGFWLI